MKFHRLCFLLVLLYASTGIRGQDLTGIWNGYITAAEGEWELPSSGYSLNIKQHSGEIISGSAYIYGTHHLKFAGLFDFIGTASAQTNRVSITELKILRYEQPSDRHLLCIKLEDLRRIEEAGAEYLVGNWEGNATDGKGCAPGRVILRKYTTNQHRPLGISDTLMQLIGQDTMKQKQFLATSLAKPIVIPVYNSRVQLELRDYLREDNDTVSVFYNRKEVVRNLRISRRPKKVTLYLNPVAELNEIILYAKNLGEIPPNTSNLTVDDGTQKHRVLIESTLQESAVIYLRYIGRSRASPLISGQRE